MANPSPEKPKAAGRTLVKYMGTADIAVLEASENFDGRLPQGLGKKYVFDASNRWVLDMSEAGSDAVELLLEDSDRFSAVSDLKRVPSNLNQKMFGGHRATEAAETALPAPEA